MPDINNLLSRLDKVKSQGKSQWRACCPAHGGNGLNLSVKQTDTGHILIKCFSHGCAVEDIINSIGLDWEDVLPDERHVETIKPQKHLLPSTDGLRMLRYESQIVLVTAYAMRNADINQSDLTRLELSMQRINHIKEACGL